MISYNISYLRPRLAYENGAYNKLTTLFWQFHPQLLFGSPLQVFGYCPQMHLPLKKYIFNEPQKGFHRLHNINSLQYYVFIIKLLLN